MRTTHFGFLGGLALGAVLMSGMETARAEPAAADHCEYRGLVTSMQRLATLAQDPTTRATTPSVSFQVQKDRVVLLDAATRETLVVAGCDGMALPVATPVKVVGEPRARTVRQGARTISATAQGALSLDFDAGAVFARSFHILAFDDGSVTVSFGPEPTPTAENAGDRGMLLYQVSTNGVGDFVEREHARIGCGCERWTTASGESGQRPLGAAR
jgi:hypothetical protein